MNKLNTFELYETPGWEDAANDIASVIRAQVNLTLQGKIDAADGWKEVLAVLHKYQPWGATDSEPLGVCVEIFCRSTGTDSENLIWY